MTLPATIQAIEIRERALMPCRQPLPILPAGELLIHVAYIGVNRADILQIEGRYAPYEGASPLPGLEVSGLVAGIGNGVRGFTVGQEVCSLLSGGGYAEYVAVPATQTLPLPAGINLKQAACLPEAAATSVMALIDEGRLKAGERVLVHGGSSGLGIIMTQIARSLGANVFATVGSEEKAVLLRKLGIHAINHRIRPFAQQVMEATHSEGVDLIIDTLGGGALDIHLRLLRPRGRLVTLAMLTGSMLPDGMKMTRILMNQLSWSGATLRNRSAAEKAAIMQYVAAHIWPKLADGTIQPVIDSVFGLLEAEKALARMQERLHLGKILLEVTAK